MVWGPFLCTSASASAPRAVNVYYAPQAVEDFDKGNNFVNQRLVVEIAVFGTNRVTKENPAPGKTLQESSRLGWRSAARGAWQPPTDVYETEGEVWVRTEIAGMKVEDFFIQLDDQVLTIRGARADTPERRSYNQMEIYFGEFAVQIELQAAVVGTQAQASYQDGFLRVMLPKAESQSIEIKG